MYSYKSTTFTPFIHSCNTYLYNCKVQLKVYLKIFVVQFAFFRFVVDDFDIAGLFLLADVNWDLLIMSGHRDP